MKVYRIDDGGAIEHYVAANTVEAIRFWCNQREQNGEIEETEDVRVDQESDRKQLSIDRNGTVITAAAMDWASTQNPGFLCSTEY